jgi:hypothetical protein
MGQVKWHALDKLVREYYSSLVSEAPPDLLEASTGEDLRSRREGRMNEKPTLALGW